MKSPIKSFCTFNDLRYPESKYSPSKATYFIRINTKLIHSHTYIHIRLIITCLGKEDDRLLWIKIDTT